MVAWILSVEITHHKLCKDKLPTVYWALTMPCSGTAAWTLRLTTWARAGQCCGGLKPLFGSVALALLVGTRVSWPRVSYKFMSSRFPCLPALWKRKNNLSVGKLYQQHRKIMAAGKTTASCYRDILGCPEYLPLERNSRFVYLGWDPACILRSRLLQNVTCFEDAMDPKKDWEKVASGRSEMGFSGL